jgi:hypothetical protein
MTLQFLRSTTIDAPPPPLLAAAFVAVGRAREQERASVHPRLPCVAYLEEWHEEEEGGGARDRCVGVVDVVVQEGRRGWRRHRRRQTSYFGVTVDVDDDNDDDGDSEE